MKNYDGFDVFVTLTGFNHYGLTKRLLEGEEVVLIKEPLNPNDPLAVAAYYKNSKIGYVANGLTTVREGTSAASFIYELMDESCTAQVVESNYSYTVCRLLGVFDTDKMTLKAFEYYNRGEYEDALKLFLELGKKYESLFLLQYTADCFIKLERPDEAEPLIKRALLKNPEDKVSLMMMGTVFEMTKRYEEALQNYKKLLELSENDAVKTAILNCKNKLKSIDNL